MQAIYEFFINKGVEWGIGEFFKRIGAWGTFFLILACGLVILGLSFLILKLILKIPNALARTIIFVVFLAVFVFGVLIAVNCSITAITKLGGLI